MKLYILILIVLVSTTALAQAVMKWETPDGKVYFGTNPPAGSVQVKQLEGTVSGISDPKMTNQQKSPEEDEPAAETPKNGSDLIP